MVIFSTVPGVNMFRHKKRAKQIIVEIIRHAGGEFHNKTNLFKAFWKAHLEFTEQNHGYLSGWPIVHMPKGPGIDKFDLLIGELLTEGAIHVKQVQKGPFDAFVFQLRDADRYSLESPASESVKIAVEWAIQRTSTEASNDSHGKAWEEAAPGSEMNIYTDLLGDDLDDDDVNAGVSAVRDLWPT